MGSRIQSYNPRQVMNRKDFEIQHKRDTFLEDVELHHHDFYEIYYLISGDVTYAIEGRMYHVMPGDILFLNPMELHQVSIKKEADAYERYVLWLDPAMLTRLSTMSTNLGRCLDKERDSYCNQLRVPPEYKPEIKKLMDDIYKESDSTGFGIDVMETSLISRLLVLLNRLADMDTSAKKEQESGSKLITDIIDYINVHYGEQLSLEEIAEQLFVSKYHLSHEFRKQMGTGVYRYIQKKRVQIARQMLANGDKPYDVYTQCGFRDYAGFYRAFTTEYGIGPREFASSLRADEAAN